MHTSLHALSIIKKLCNNYRMDEHKPITKKLQPDDQITHEDLPTCYAWHMNEWKAIVATLDAAQTQEAKRDILMWAKQYAEHAATLASQHRRA